MKSLNNPEKKTGNDLPGYPRYSEEEDIYNHDKKEENKAPEEIKEEEHLNDPDARITLHEEMDENLDVPGADLDDEDENIGEEDEENNYYSLGGDRHE